MKVSSSKFRFSIIAITAILVMGTGMGANQALGAVPTFIAIHNSTTTTELIFSEAINGTKRFIDWQINGINATAITNGTVPNANDKVLSAATLSGNNGVGSGLETFGFYNRTLTAMITHHVIGTGDTLLVNYTGGQSDAWSLTPTGNVRSSPQVVDSDAFHPMSAADMEITAIDQVAPTVVTAKMIDAKRIQITMSEPIGNVNTTASDFTISGGLKGVQVGSIIAANGTVAGGNSSSEDKIIYLTTSTPMDTTFTRTLYLAYGNLGTTTDTGAAALTASVRTNTGHFITDDTNSYKYGCRTSCDEASASNVAGVGNRLANFTDVLIINTLGSNGGEVINTDTAPKVVAKSIQVNNGFVEALIDATPMNVDVEVGDTVTFDFTISDENGAYTIPYVALYTNFIDRPDDMNLFYTNNFDSVSQESATYYEWNVRSDDVAYAYSDTLSWNPATYKSVDADTIEVSFSFNVDNTMDPTQVWLQVGDTTYNFNNQQLPLTLDVTGDELLNFENTSNQKLIGFLNESVLSSIVSGWTNSNDDLANVVELSSALGVDGDRLPSWTTNLANWVVEDDINAAEMIVAVEYLINQ